VFFRASTRQQAIALGLAGYARNLPDGRVEVLACGDESALQVLQAWLRAGPIGATVSGVQCETVDVAVPPDFSIT
jgi:acylphosphatase